MDALATYGRETQKMQEALVLEHTTLVKRIAWHLMGKLPPSVQIDDLIQAGMLGLLEAIQNYDASKGATFETYAGIRIRGFMLDEVRQNDWVPRSVYKNGRMIAETVRNLEHKLGRAAREAEIASELNLPLKEYQSMLQDSACAHMYGFEDLGVTEEVLKEEIRAKTTEPHAQVLHYDLMQKLAEIINGLPNKEKLVLSLYYERDLNLKEIGEVLEVSESRISQILSQATLRLRSRMPE